MTAIQLTITATPKMPESLLRQVLAQAARENKTPDQWISEAFTEYLKSDAPMLKSGRSLTRKPSNRRVA